MKSKLPTTRYFNDVRDDLSKFPEAIELYEKVIVDARPHITACGHLQSMIAETPGLAHFYKGYATDASQIRKWLELRAEILELQKYKWLMTSAAAKNEYGELKTTEAGKFARADPEVVDMQDFVRIAAYYEHMLDDICMGFQSRGINLSHIVKIREGGFEEVWVDPSQETKNE